MDGIPSDDSDDDFDGYVDNPVIVNDGFDTSVNSSFQNYSPSGPSTSSFQNYSSFPSTSSFQNYSTSFPSTSSFRNYSFDTYSPSHASASSFQCSPTVNYGTGLQYHSNTNSATEISVPAPPSPCTNTSSTLCTTTRSIDEQSLTFSRQGKSHFNVQVVMVSNQNKCIHSQQYQV